MTSLISTSGTAPMMEIESVTVISFFKNGRWSPGLINTFSCPSQNPISTDGMTGYIRWVNAGTKGMLNRRAQTVLRYVSSPVDSTGTQYPSITNKATTHKRETNTP